MSITLTPEKQAFIKREIAVGSFKSEAEAVERALELFERRLQDLRAAIDEADMAVAEGSVCSIDVEEFLSGLRMNAT